jgi:uncharacterized protein YjbJ (UPF0337 family)
VELLGTFPNLGHARRRASEQKQIKRNSLTDLRIERETESVTEEANMDWNQLEGNWKQVRGTAKAKWGKLTDADLTEIEGRREQLEGKIQERYGYTKERVRKELDDWYRSLSDELRESREDLIGQIDTIRSDIQSLSSTIARLGGKQIERAQDTAVDAFKQADEAIRRNPLNAIAIALGLGFLIGILTRR